MAKGSYLQKLAGGAVLTSLLAGSASESGCALQRRPIVEQDYVDVKIWHNADNLMIEYDKNVFYVVPSIPMPNENAASLIERVITFFGNRIDPRDKKFAENKHLVAKGADLLAMLDYERNNLDFSSSGQIKQVRLREVKESALRYDIYRVPIPTRWNSIKQALDFYEGR